MSISAQAVKELRERTGLGMMDCKKAPLICYLVKLCFFRQNDKRNKRFIKRYGNETHNGRKTCKTDQSPRTQR